MIRLFVSARGPLVLLLAALAAACAPTSDSDPPVPPIVDLRPTVILISFDGWRWDYDHEADTPNLDRLAAAGVRAERLIPVFPAKTFPNHYSLVTGVHPDRHGIVSNNMYDPETGERFSLGNREAVEDGRWWGAEPIWVAAERQGQASATLFWPGSEAEIAGVRPRYWMPYDASMPGEERVRQVLDWLDLPAAERPTFITLYFSDTDSAGHRHGPSAPEVLEAVQRLDGWLGLLLHGLEARGIADRANVIVTSDHGMAARDPDALIFLDDYLDLSTVLVVDWTPVLGIWPLRTGTAAVHAALRNAHPRLRVFAREEVPDRFRLKDHPRTPPIVGLADEGWTIATRGRLARLRANWNRGDHGYDPHLPSMHGVFVAAGPAFAQGLAVPPLQMVQIYGLMADVLGLETAPHEGEPLVWRRMLRQAAEGDGRFDPALSGGRVEPGS